MRPTIRNIACKHTLNLSSTLFRTRPFRPTHLLSLGERHASTTSNFSREEALRQARVKQWHEHLHTKFVRTNGHTSLTFKIRLADIARIARRAEHTVNERDGVANPRWDWTEKTPILKRAAGDGKGVVQEDIDDHEWELEGEEGEAIEDDDAIEDEDVTENRLGHDLVDLEEEVVDLLEHVRMLKGGKKEIIRHAEKHEEAGASISCWIRLTRIGGW